MGVSNNVIFRTALGEDVQLGMLYDARTSVLFGGLSLWDNDVVNANTQTIQYEKIQDADYSHAYSIQQARQQASLDVEASLELDLKMVKVSGSAKYLGDSQSSLYEARLDTSYNITRRTRRIPQEILAKPRYMEKLDDKRFTHYVGEVTEGAKATVSIVKTTSSKVDNKKISGQLQVTLMGIKTKGQGKIKYEELEESDRENVKISYSGPFAETCTTWEDARRIAAEMPGKLALQTNTLSYRLYPVELVDNKVQRVIRSIDNGVIGRLSNIVKNGTLALLKLDELMGQDIYQKSFPSIKEQILKFQTAFQARESVFSSAACDILPKLRDGEIRADGLLTNLTKAMNIYQQCIEIATSFIKKKEMEAGTLRKTVDYLLKNGFQNNLEDLTGESLVGTSIPKILLSFGGEFINRSEHPLQNAMGQVGGIMTKDTVMNNPGEDGNEWFKDFRCLSTIKKSSQALIELRAREPHGLLCGVASVNKAYQPGSDKLVATQLGDLLLDLDGKIVIITDLLPGVPKAPKLSVKGLGINVSWSKDRTEREELALPTLNFIVRYRSMPDVEKDSNSPAAKPDGLFTTIICKPSERSLQISSNSSGRPLFDNCEYEIAFATNTVVGRSEWSVPVVCRTPQLSPESTKIMPHPVFNTDTIHANEYIRVDESLYDKTNRFNVTLQRDGNLVIYDRGNHGRGFWHSQQEKMPTTPPKFLALGANCDVCLYDANGTIYWSTGTKNKAKRDIHLTMQKDGNLVLYGDGKALWASAQHAAKA